MSHRSAGRRVSARREASLLRRRRKAEAPVSTEPVDYLTLKAPPEDVVGPGGRYRAGWYEKGGSRLNVEDSSAPKRHLQGWLHISFVTQTHFVVADIADLTIAGNTSVLIMDRRTGRFEEASVKHVVRRRVGMAQAWQRFEDTSSGSFIELDGDRVDFRVLVGGAALEGAARVIDEPFVQVSAAHGGHGVYQRWGNLSLIRGEARWDGGKLSLPEGTEGAFDHTVGHRRRLQSWNWLSVLGRAEDGMRFSMQMACDQPGARPQVVSEKNNLWIDGRLHKLADLSFDYAVEDPRTMRTGAWRIVGGKVPGAWVDLVFEPRFHRRNKDRLPLVYEVDFNQYYGEVRGSFGLGSRRWTIREQFGLTEDSWMML